MSRITGQPWRSVAGGRGDHPRAKQQEAGKHEEERDTDFEARVDGADVPMGELAGGEGRVRCDDEQRGDGPHAGKAGLRELFSMMRAGGDAGGLPGSAPLQRTSGLANTASSVARKSVAQLRKRRRDVNRVGREVVDEVSVDEVVQRRREACDAGVVELGEQDDALILREKCVGETVRVGAVAQHAGVGGFVARRSEVTLHGGQFVGEVPRRSSSVVDSSAAKLPKGQPTARPNCASNAD